MTYKIIIGNKYKNIHTNIIYKVVSKSFYIVGYVDINKLNLHPNYIHYKKFIKHWNEL